MKFRVELSRKSLNVRKVSEQNRSVDNEMVDLGVDEWTQAEYLTNKQSLEAQGIRVVLVDTILNPIEGTESITYNPPLLREMPSGSVFVFYCDSGKGTHSRLKEFRMKFPHHVCISLRGGRGYWRRNMSV